MRRCFLLILVLLAAVFVTACARQWTERTIETMRGIESPRITITDESAAGVDSPSAIREYETDGWSPEAMLRKPPYPAESGDNTVLTAKADAHTPQALYLWEMGNQPAVTEYENNSRGYFDDPDFRPYVTSLPVPEGVPVKGAVLLCAGGAYEFRGDYTDAIPVAEELCSLGFQCFIVDYRLRPWTQQEGALDLARAVRFVRKNADAYGIDPKDIAVMGFSAGGIQAGEMLLNFDGLINGTILDPDYIPDELDEISADAAAVGMIYAFYGRLSVASRDVDALRAGELPPTYFCYGTEDPFYRQFMLNADCLREAGVDVTEYVMEDWPHGFGADGNWIPAYAEWLEKVFADNGTPEREIEPDVTADTTVGEVVTLPAFADFGYLLFPVDRPVTNDRTLADISDSATYLWYNYIDPEKTVEIVNELKHRAESGETIFYDIYSEEEKNADPTKHDTGLFFFRGEPGAKYAVVNAGGGFAYVGAMHDSFPQALALSRMGYNAFALIYRPDDPYNDLAQAIAFITNHAEELGVDPEGYSLWGGSAGARMAATLGNREILHRVLGADALEAAAVIMQYTGYSAVSEYDAPTYVCVGTNDGIANWQTMQRRLEALDALSIPTEFHAYEGLPHGFGLGTGTAAEGWIRDAVAFWEEQQ